VPVASFPTIFEKKLLFLLVDLLVEEDFGDNIPALCNVSSPTIFSFPCSSIAKNLPF
jgi:hypothetical protein